MRTQPLNVGEPAPWFVSAASSNPTFHFDTVAGRYVVLCFFGSTTHPATRRVLEDFYQDTDKVFDTLRACFFGVCTNPEDRQRVHDRLPGLQFFWDFGLSVSRLFGAVTEGKDASYRPHTLVLDERLRVLASFPIDGDGTLHATRVLQFLTGLAPMAPSARAAVQAPVLVVPRVFEPALCQTLIRYYDERGGNESGFMRDVDGKTVEVMDHAHKRRRDQEIEDETLRNACMHRIHDRLVPEIHKAFQFRASRIERYIVACYEAETGGQFRAHRDNTTKGTAHRRFAVTLNLNTGAYDGGELRFPEFGQATYVAPAGGVVVFSCSLLHEATPVTRGKRYAFLPFLYDEAARRVRDENLKFVGDAASSQAPQT